MWDKDWDHFTSKNVCLVPQRLLKRPSLVPLYCGVSSVINKVVMYIGLLLAHHLFCCFIHTSLWNTLLSSLLKIYNIVTSTSIPLSAFFFLKIIFATLRLSSCIFMGKVVHFHEESFMILTGMALKMQINLGEVDTFVAWCLSSITLVYDSIL